MTGGEAPNIIPQTAVLEGTIRSFDRDLSAQLFTRIGEIARCTAQAFRGTAVTEEIASAPPLRNDACLLYTSYAAAEISWLSANHAPAQL